MTWLWLLAAFLAGALLVAAYGTVIATRAARLLLRRPAGEKGVTADVGVLGLVLAGRDLDHRRAVLSKAWTDLVLPGLRKEMPAAASKVLDDFHLPFPLREQALAEDEAIRALRMLEPLDEYSRARVVAVAQHRYVTEPLLRRAEAESAARKERPIQIAAVFTGRETGH